MSCLEDLGSKEVIIWAALVFWHSPGSFYELCFVRKGLSQVWFAAFVFCLTFKYLSFVYSALEGSLKNGDSHPPHYLSRLNCSSCGTPSTQHSEVCPKTSRSRLTEDMAELHSEYSDSSCGEFLWRMLNVDQKKYYLGLEVNFYSWFLLNRKRYILL